MIYKNPYYVNKDPLKEIFCGTVNADTALYYSKKHGRDQVNIFNSDMEESGEEE